VLDRRPFFLEVFLMPCCNEWRAYENSILPDDVIGIFVLSRVGRQQLSTTTVGQEVVNDGFNGHSRGDLEENTYVAGMKATLPSTDDTCVAGMKATLPSTDDWIVVNRRLRNERKAHSFDLIPLY
jgi:hypothetical protein